jgi:hypothetical protein
MIGVMASDYEGVKKWRGVRRVTEGGHGKRQQVKWRKTRDNDSPFGERLTWKGAGHVANDKWMMRRRRTTRTKEGRWMDDTRQQGKGGMEDDMTGEGPTRVKHRAAEKDGAA